MTKKTAIFVAWLFLTVAIAGYYLGTLFLNEDKSDFLIGDTSHGHYQIEMACTTCHTEPFGGKEIIQNACVQCHAKELEEAHDSHPKSKFTDPREAYRLEVLDARYCVTCHTEHKPLQTGAMGLSLPGDYCYLCHKEVGEERESHKGLPFDSCASAGCHNFHDNRALYESFLVEHANEPWLKTSPHLPARSNAFWSAAENIIASGSAALPPGQATPNDWPGSRHQLAGLNCQSCHATADDDTWIEKPSIVQCQSCHQYEAITYTEGKHGMRLARQLGGMQAGTDAPDLSPLTPSISAMPFHHDALTVEHGCNTCHGAHKFDAQRAAVEACLSCHNDEHSLSYEASAHAALWKSEQSGELPQGSGVSCASCHMPRIDAGRVDIEKNKSGTDIASNKLSAIDAETVTEKSSTGSEVLLVKVQHNQNWNLRPNEKMIRSVCMNCHGLAFSIDALASEKLVRSNFSSKPVEHVESIDWAVSRD